MTNVLTTVCMQPIYFYTTCEYPRHWEL